MNIGPTNYTRATPLALAPEPETLTMNQYLGDSTKLARPMAFFKMRGMQDRDHVPSAKYPQEERWHCSSYGTNHDWTFERFAHLLTFPTPVQYKGQGDAIVCGQMQDDHRSRAELVHMDCMVLDVDKVNPGLMSLLWVSLEGIRFVANTSFSHTLEAPCWRVYLPLDEPVLASEYKSAGEALLECLGDAVGATKGDLDRVTCSMSQAFYLNQVPLDGEALYECKDANGQPLSTRALVLDGEVLRNAAKSSSTKALVKAVSSATAPAFAGASNRALDPSALVSFDIDGQPFTMSAANAGDVVRDAGDQVSQGRTDDGGKVTDRTSWMVSAYACRGFVDASANRRATLTLTRYESYQETDSGEVKGAVKTQDILTLACDCSAHEGRVHYHCEVKATKMAHPSAASGVKIPPSIATDLVWGGSPTARVPKPEVANVVVLLKAARDTLPLMWTTEHDGVDRVGGDPVGGPTQSIIRHAMSTTFGWLPEGKLLEKALTAIPPDFRPMVWHHMEQGTAAFEQWSSLQSPMDDFWTEVFGFDDLPSLERDMLSRWYIGCVVNQLGTARVEQMRPGHGARKLDSCLTLLGEKGDGKSTLAKLLFDNPHDKAEGLKGRPSLCLEVTPASGNRFIASAISDYGLVLLDEVDKLLINWDSAGYTKTLLTQHEGFSERKSVQGGRTERRVGFIATTNEERYIANEGRNERYRRWWTLDLRKFISKHEGKLNGAHRFDGAALIALQHALYGWALAQIEGQGVWWFSGPEMDAIYKQAQSHLYMSTKTEDIEEALEEFLTGQLYLVKEVKTYLSVEKGIKATQDKLAKHLPPGWVLWRDASGSDRSRVLCKEALDVGGRRELLKVASNTPKSQGGF